MVRGFSDDVVDVGKRKIGVWGRLRWIEDVWEVLKEKMWKE